MLVQSWLQVPYTEHSSKSARKKIQGMVIGRVMRAGKCVPSNTTAGHPYSYVGGHFGRML